MGKLMYPYVTTVNPGSGSCEYQCEFCYMNELKRNFSDVRKKYSGVARMDDKALKKICGSGKVYFVGSGVDLFGYQISLMPEILERCCQYDNYYIFHTKNSYGFDRFLSKFPDKTILAVTIESDEDMNLISVAPEFLVRFLCLTGIKRRIKNLTNSGAANWTIKPRVMITIEPIMKFTARFAEQLIELAPDIVVIGADSGKHDLPEPSFEEVRELIDALTAALPYVRLKDTLFDRYPELPYERWTDDIWRINNE